MNINRRHMLMGMGGAAAAGLAGSLPAFAEASSQTESGSASVREHLGQALRCLSFCLSCVFDSRPYVS